MSNTGQAAAASSSSVTLSIKTVLRTATPVAVPLSLLLSVQGTNVTWRTKSRRTVLMARHSIAGRATGGSRAEAAPPAVRSAALSPSRMTMPCDHIRRAHYCARSAACEAVTNGAKELAIQKGTPARIQPEQR
jgi:hypothetical protein